MVFTVLFFVFSIRLNLSMCSIEWVGVSMPLRLPACDANASEFS